MDKNGIDNLLQIVSPDLIEGYEAKNLDGKTLRGIYEEYKVVSAKRKKMIMDKPFFGFLLPFAFICWLVILGAGKAYNGSSIVVASAPGVIAFIAYVLIYWRTLNIAWGYNKTIAQCEEVIEEFRQSVEALDPNWCSPDDEYTASSVRHTAGRFAIRLLDAERKFRKVRMQDYAPTWDVRHHADWEDRMRDEFEKMLSAAEKFGLVYTKKDKDGFFAKAQKHLDKYQ